MNFTADLLFCSLIALSLCLLKLRSMSIEFNALFNAVRDTFQNKSAKLPRNLSATKKQRITLLTSLLQNKLTSLTENKEHYANLLKDTGVLSELSMTPGQSSSSLAQIAKRFIPKEAAFAAIVLVDSDNWSTPYYAGLHKERVSKELFSTAEKFLSQENAPWGFINSDTDSYFSLSKLGIESNFSVPLLDKDKPGSKIIGFFWLGFTKHKGHISFERKRTIEALARHASIALGSSKKIHALLNSNQEEKNFLLGFSHDLRSPGSHALYALHQLQEASDVFSEEQQAHLALISESLNQQLSMINDILSHAKNKNELVKALPQTIELSEFVKSIAIRFKAIAQSENRSLKVNIQPNLQGLFDPNHLKRIISNLIENALRHTDHGDILLSVKLDNKDIVITVEDSGLGIENPEEIFETFKSSSGFGLGLSLSKNLAEENTASLNYENANPGSRFILRFEATTTTQAESPKIDSALIIDDNPATCRMVKRYLKDYTADIYMAHSIEEAEDKINTLKPSLVITDYNLPGGTAEFFLSKSKHRHKTILLSGMPQTPQLVEFRSKYTDNYIEKPFTEEIFTASLKSCFQ